MLKKTATKNNNNKKKLKKFNITKKETQDGCAHIWAQKRLESQLVL